MTEQAQAWLPPEVALLAAVPLFEGIGDDAIRALALAADEDAYAKGQVIDCPVAHHDGNYFADAETLARLEGEGRVAFRYALGTNPNGSINDIAGILNKAGNVLGMMPHPENLIEALHGGLDGRGLFESVAQAIAA